MPPEIGAMDVDMLEDEIYGFTGIHRRTERWSVFP
jgi:hypothetical protein